MPREVSLGQVLATMSESAGTLRHDSPRGSRATITHWTSASSRVGLGKEDNFLYENGGGLFLFFPGRLCHSVLVGSLYNSTMTQRDRQSIDDRHGIFGKWPVN
jgi:hypothetical protein